MTTFQPQEKYQQYKLEMNLHSIERGANLKISKSFFQISASNNDTHHHPSLSNLKVEKFNTIEI
jgi:hypothetical protein